ncbi:MAG: hypothetical protein LBU32_10545 [Clostridiales bacterium]|nr:hypothetical protein [Clostridiales bacterium]
MLKNRKAMAALTAVALTALIITGTFAWTNFNASMKNEWAGKGSQAGGTLHDDFQDPNKDIYIENWGTKPILVRIRLDEYMEVGEKAGLKGDPVANTSLSLVDGKNINDKGEWSPHIPKSKDTPEIGVDPFDAYWEWDMGGTKWYLPALKSVRANADGTANSYVDQNNDAVDSTSVNADGVLAKQTPDADVITYEKWEELGAPIGDYWVIDTDGWAYYAKPVAPGEATGLLLDSVQLKKKPIDNYYYGINVLAQMATKDGVDAQNNPDNYTNFGDPERGGWSAGGQKILGLVAAFIDVPVPSMAVPSEPVAEEELLVTPPAEEATSAPSEAPAEEPAADEDQTVEGASGDATEGASQDATEGASPDATEGASQDETPATEAIPADGTETSSATE